MSRYIEYTTVVAEIKTNIEKSSPTQTISETIPVQNRENIFNYLSKQPHGWGLGLLFKSWVKANMLQSSKEKMIE